MTRLTAHPRSRGENDRAGRRRRCERGSSPLTRGKPRRRQPVPDRRGLIPAHAGKTTATTSTERRPRAHPRSRGENRCRRSMARSSTGSSPLTRGKQETLNEGGVKARLIPAHAGKTINSRGGGICAWAHPRSRGENRDMAFTRSSYVGSSPLTRGKRLTVAVGTARGRLIPAHAGKTAATARAAPSSEAHPRSRGENLAPMMMRFGTAGSSPLTRGKPRRGGVEPRRLRLIPAHAGKTSCPTRPSSTERAHPRSRGENRRNRGRKYGGLGSSPLTRGKRDVGGVRPSGGGLIPAHAGKTRSSPWSPSPSTAHPRSRGENPIDDLCGSKHLGSSPLTRGKHCGLTFYVRRRRLIPAHAGKTPRSRERYCAGRAHPRSRGENLGPIISQVGEVGSSPLTRGKPHRSSPARIYSGLIPAHAGKTDGLVLAIGIIAAHPRSRGENRQ